MPTLNDLDHDASSLLVGLLPEVRGQRWLIVDDPAPALPEALREGGAQVAAWHRSALTGAAQGEPPAGPFDAFALRLPRAREAYAWALEAAAARCAPGATLWVYGPNEEGAKSAANHLAPWWAEAETMDTRRKCRLWRAVRTAAPARGALADHLRPARLQAPGGALDLVAGPGVFAKGELDAGTRLLLGALDRLPHAPARALDFGCGIGVVAAFLMRRFPGCAVDGLDADAVAVAAAKVGLPAMRAVAGDGWAALSALPEAGPYDLIASNPPIHQGKALDFSVLAALVDGAASRLNPGGRLVMVVQQQRAIGDWLREALPQVKIVAEDRQFKVWEARR